MSPMFCSACAGLACHPLHSLFLTLFTSFLSSIFHSHFSPHPPHPHTSLSYPSPFRHGDVDEEIGPLHVCERNVVPQTLAPPGDQRGDWSGWEQRLMCLVFDNAQKRIKTGEREGLLDVLFFFPKMKIYPWLHNRICLILTAVAVEPPPPISSFHPISSSSVH